MILCPSVWFSYSSLAEKYQQQSWADLEKKIQKGISERVGSGSQMWREAEGADLGLKRSRVATGTWGQPTATSAHLLSPPAFSLWGISLKFQVLKENEVILPRVACLYLGLETGRTLWVIVPRNLRTMIREPRERDSAVLETWAWIWVGGKGS